jgi:hypothetical protein
MAIGKLQRKCACGNDASGGVPSEKKHERSLQRSPLHEQPRGNAPPLVHEVLGSPGQGLDASARAMMEPHFGHDFCKVRVHTGEKAAASARSVNAQAYTVGNDIVFGAGGYAPSQPAGRQLLAHELTHVVQQAGAGKPSGNIPIGEAGDHMEQEAESNATGIGQAGAGARATQQAAASLQKDPTVPSPTALNLPTDSVYLGSGETPSVENPKLVQLAASFKGQADSGAHIKISTYLSEAAKMNTAKGREEKAQLAQRMNAIRQVLIALGVPDDSILVEAPTAYASKSAGEISARVYKTPQAPPNFLLPPPKPAPGGSKAPGPAPAPAAPGLGDMLSFKFKAGPVDFAVELPKSVAVKLPIALGSGGVRSLAFELKAESSGDFSFAIVLNGFAHVKVSAKAGLKVDKDKGTSGSVGLEIATMATTCNAPSPESLKTKINSAGEKLKKAMKELETATEVDRTLKLFDIAGAIGEMYDAVEKAKAGCKQVPRATFNFGLQGPLAPSDKALEDPSLRTPTYLGGSITIPF